MLYTSQCSCSLRLSNAQGFGQRFMQLISFRQRPKLTVGRPINRGHILRARADVECIHYERDLIQANFRFILEHIELIYKRMNVIK